MGKQLDVRYYYTDLSTPYPGAIETPATFVVGDGTETTIDIENVTDIVVDISEASILFSFDTSFEPAPPTFGSAAFNGLEFNLLSGTPLNFIGASIDPTSTLAGFDATRVSFTDTQVRFNWENLTYDSGTILRVNFTQGPAEVPEPATMSLLGLGFLGVAAMHRRRAVRPRNTRVELD